MQRYNDFFGSYGGRFVAEMLRAPLDDLQEAFLQAAADTGFTRELTDTLRDFAGVGEALELDEDRRAAELPGGVLRLHQRCGPAGKVPKGLGQLPVEGGVRRRPQERLLQVVQRGTKHLRDEPAAVAAEKVVIPFS